MIGQVSWDEQFALHYEEWSAEMSEDVPFYVALAGEVDGPLAELAVGSGRVAIPVARATGRTVIGRLLAGNARQGRGRSVRGWR